MNNQYYCFKHYIVNAIVIIVLLATAGLSACSQVISGVRDGPIENHPDRRTTGEVIDDNLIETKAQVNLAKASPALAQSRLVVVSFNGIILLAGQVPSEVLKQLAVQTVYQIHKVRLVHDELTVGDPIAITTRARDAWLTTKIKSQVLANSVPQGSTIKVVTENNIVYLMGLITPSSEEAAQQVTDIARNTVGVKKVVRLFEYID